MNMTSYEGLTLVPILIRRSSADIKLLVPSEQTNTNGFRKIEPKPYVVNSDSVVEDAGAGDDEAEIRHRRKKKGTTPVRFLGSNATRRGVRICVTCKGQIGYRSKKCKHCLKIPALNESNLETSQKKPNKDVMLPNNTVEYKLQEKENAVETRHENKVPSLAASGQSKTKIPSIKANKSEERVLALGGYPENRSDVELCSNDTTQVEKVSSEELSSNDIQQQTNLQSETHDNITRKSGPKSKEYLSQDVPSGQEPCTDSDDNLTEKKPVIEHQDISDLCISTDESKNLGAQTGSKRKQRLHIPGRKNKQRKVCSVLQFVRIEPKPYLEQAHKSSVEHVIQNNPAKCRGKIDPKRFLASNPTRRGIMTCPLCQKEVGCRSKTCKHCKVAIHFAESKALEHNNLLIVQLSPSTDPECAVFSVKKTPTPSEERCFIRQTIAKNEFRKDCKEISSSTHDGFNWSCECVQSDKVTNSPICEHTMCFFRSPKIVQARTATLTAQTIDCLPIDSSFKDKLKELWEKNQTSERPLVQQVALNTLVVLDTEKNIDLEGDCRSGAHNTTCVHIRFEKVKRHSFVQPHIFCSGKSCSFWSSFENQKDSPDTCLHYCISLWAIASDNELEGYFKIFLEAPQVYLHSEVFESIVSP